MADAAANTASNTPLIDRGDAISNAPKKKIPSDDLAGMLNNADQLNKIAPLIANVVKNINDDEELMNKIEKLFLDLASNNEPLKDALTKLQKELREIYKTQYEGIYSARQIKMTKSEDVTGAAPTLGRPGQIAGKKRKSKKRNYYKKRRTSKYR
jgi:hypothetical protein